MHTNILPTNMLPLFQNNIPPTLECISDLQSLVMVFSNLLENAVHYCDAKGPVLSTAKETDRGIEISIANTGCTLTAEQASRVFEPFWRADPSRKEAGVHCGLGLAVAREIVLALDGSIDVQVQEGGVFVVRIVLPVKTQRRSNQETAQ